MHFSREDEMHEMIEPTLTSYNEGGREGKDCNSRDFSKIYKICTSAFKEYILTISVTVAVLS